MSDNYHILHKMLACPVCNSKLNYGDSFLKCLKCQAEYSDKNGIIIFNNKNSEFQKIEQKYWDNTYQQEGTRSLLKRNHYFHHHFRQPLKNLACDSWIIELGCGSRADSLELAAERKKVVLTDISLIALSEAQKLSKQMMADNNSFFIQASAEQIPFADNSFEGALMAASFHHLSNPLLGLKEMKRVVKDNGYVILGVEPASWPYKTIYKALLPLKKYIRNKRQRSIDSIADDTTEGFSKKDLSELFNKAGLEIIEIKPVKFTLEYYDSYLRLKNTLLNNQSKASDKIQKTLSIIDRQLEKIPIINNFPWHWNIISKVNK